MDLFSVTISVICIVDDGKLPDDGYTQDIQVHIVRAADFEDAKEQAITIGNAEENEYLNSEGNTVCWRFKAIEHIRRLGSELTGVEVASRLEKLKTQDRYRPDHNFSPEASEPICDEESAAKTRNRRKT